MPRRIRFPVLVYAGDLSTFTALRRFAEVAKYGARPRFRLSYADIR
jgi:hypothetical protein